MDKKLSFITIGAGKLGNVFTKELFLHHQCLGVIDKTIKKAKSLAKEIKSVGYKTITLELIKKTKIIVITVNDEQISSVVSEILKLNSSLKEKYFFHTSGSLSSEILLPLQKKGAIIFSLHPNASFTHSCHEINLSEIPLFYEGSGKKSKEMALFLCKELDTELFGISKEQKPLYHAISVMITNFITQMLYFADKNLFHSNEDAVIAYYKLIDTTVHNYYHSSEKISFTGPVTRVDIDTINKNISSLKNKEMISLYKIISQNTINILKENKLLSKLEIEKIRKNLLK